MNKIKNIHQLKLERKKLSEERNRIERILSDDWKGIKKSFSPVNAPVKMLSRIFYNNIENKIAKSFLAGEASLIALNLTSNIVETGFTGLKKWFRQKYGKHKSTN